MASSFDEENAMVGTNLERMRELVASLARADKTAATAANLELQKLQRDTEKSLKVMETEVRNAAPSARLRMREAVTRANEEMTRLRAAVRKANEDAARAELMKDSAPDARRSKIEADSRDRAVATAEAASRGTNKLQSAAALVSETQDIGINVVDTMQQQRESLIRSTDKHESVLRVQASDVTGLTGVARGVMLAMQRRAITNKFLLGGAILVLLGCIGVVVYFGYVKS